jgi:hypothetical protein
MSKAFPTDKDHVLNELDDAFGLNLTDGEYAELRQLTLSKLFLITMLMSRVMKFAVTKVIGEEN